jgi:hypothetical protein
MLPLLAGAGRLLASGAGKKVADSASKRAAGTAGKKLSKDKFFNKEEKQESDNIKTGMARPSISPTKLLPPSDIKDPPKKVDLSKGGEEGGIKDTFNKIDDTLNGIISSINRENQFRKKESEDSRKRAELENKQRQENKLERGGKSRGIGPSIKLPGDGFGIGKFFKNIIIGGLILAIMKNLQSIIEFFKKTYKQVKEFMEKLGEFLTPIWDGLKWIVGEGIKLVAKILGIPEEDVDDKDILKNLNEILKQIPLINNLFKGIKDAVDSIDTNSGSSSSSSSPRSSYSKAGEIPSEVTQDTEFTQGVTNLAKKYNVPEDYLYAVMGFETGGTFDPSVKNQAGSGATGLIQFMDSTAEGLGTTTDKLAGMSRSEQLVYVDKYFSGKGIEGGSLSDIYMAVLFPAAVGKPDDFVLFGKGAMSGYTGKAYEQNKGLDKNNDGSITKAEASESVSRYLPKNSVPSNIPEYDENKTYKVGDVVMKNGKNVKFDGFGWAEVQGITSQNLGGGQAPAPVASPAQVQSAQSSAASSASAISESADYEIPGGVSGTMIMPMQSQGGSPTMSGGGGGGMMPVGISKKEVLNSLYQAQLVGFLYKQG